MVLCSIVVPQVCTRLRNVNDRTMNYRDLDSRLTNSIGGGSKTKAGQIGCGPQQQLVSCWSIARREATPMGERVRGDFI